MPHSPSPLVGIIMGSKSDQPTLQHAADTLAQLGIPYEMRIISAHRTPDVAADYAKTAEARGLQVIIAGAGGAAHLAGVTAAFTVLPVLGVPMQSSALNGLDSLLSIVQMPGGVPVATLAIGNPAPSTPPSSPPKSSAPATPNSAKNSAPTAKPTPKKSSTKNSTRPPNKPGDALAGTLQIKPAMASPDPTPLASALPSLAPVATRRSPPPKKARRSQRRRPSCTPTSTNPPLHTQNRKLTFIRSPPSPPALYHPSISRPRCASPSRPVKIPP